MNPYSGLSAAEAERLYILIEECSEVIQAATKVLRHGWESVDPTVPPAERFTNRITLEKEIGHVVTINALMVERGDLDHDRIIYAARAKLATINQWPHHNDFRDIS